MYQSKGPRRGGRDLIALGIPAGKAIGDMLQELLELVLEEPERNTRDELLAVCRDRMQSFRK